MARRLGTRDPWLRSRPQPRLPETALTGLQTPADRPRHKALRVCSPLSTLPVRRLAPRAVGRCLQGVQAADCLLGLATCARALAPTEAQRSGAGSHQPHASRGWLQGHARLRRAWPRSVPACCEHWVLAAWLWTGAPMALASASSPVLGTGVLHGDGDERGHRPLLRYSMWTMELSRRDQA